jgi:exoribonuclease II
MVWDLGKAMQKKEEFESARLMDFEFRQRVRATRLFAQKVGADEAELLDQLVLRKDRTLIQLLAQAMSCSVSDLNEIYESCLGEARLQLISEIGDPTPYRLG